MTRRTFIAALACLALPWQAKACTAGNVCYECFKPGEKK